MNKYPLGKNIGSISEKAYNNLKKYTKKMLPS
jgi:hypothetical protein